MPKMIIQNVRCSYVLITNEPRKKDNGDPGNYSIQILISKKDPQLDKIKKLIDQTLEDKQGPAALKTKNRYKLPLRDGDDERDTEEYAGMCFMNASAKKKPGIVNRNNEPADADDLEEYCYSGAYFHVSVNFYYFTPKDNNKPGVAVGLNNVMLRKKGERLDGRVAATSEFKLLDEEDEEEEDEFDIL